MPSSSYKLDKGINLISFFALVRIQLSPELKRENGEAPFHLQCQEVVCVCVCLGAPEFQTFVSVVYCMSLLGSLKSSET